MADITQATGLSRSSLYQGFGYKQEVLGAAIEHYAQSQAKRLEAALGGRPLRMALRQIFDGIASDNNRGRGCLLGNCAVELGPHDGGIAERVRRGIEAQAGVFEGRIVRAQRDGEVDSRRSAADLAHYLTASITGMRVMAKTGIAPRALRAVGRTVLSTVFEPQQ